MSQGPYHLATIVGQDAGVDQAVNNVFGAVGYVVGIDAARFGDPKKY